MHYSTRPLRDVYPNSLRYRAGRKCEYVKSDPGMSEKSTELVSDLYSTLVKSVAQKFKTKIPGQPEDQLKAPVETLLLGLGKLNDISIVVKTESAVGEISGRPDMGVATGGLLSGHVELKAPGLGARIERFKGRDRAQWKKFALLPNIIYTDGNEWALYRTGERVGDVIRISDDITEGKSNPASFADAKVIFDRFLAWQPIVPSTPAQLAKLLAPLCRLLKSDVLDALERPESNIAVLRSDWQATLFPDASNEQFADAYAQTIAYALLLARLDGLKIVSTATAPARLKSDHTLLGSVLRILADDSARDELETSIVVLERAIQAVDVSKLSADGSDPWLYFYEDFLAEYDPKLRKDRGVYYTPVEVVQAQTILVSEILKKKFKKVASYADADVVTLDPAVGTGTYLLAVIEHALETVSAAFGAGAVAAYASTLGKNLNGFEILVGPYAVAHLRVTERIVDSGGTLPVDGLHVFLTDTLESPFVERPVELGLLYKPLTDEHLKAQRVKRSTRVLVCIGNPPYDREERDDGDSGERKGGWVRYGDKGSKEVPILDAFLKPARNAGAGVHLKNLYNDYVYFWRWGIWKVFDSASQPGIISFISAASYLRGPGFVGMREVMRRTFDDMWIIDLEGDNRGPRKTENVFQIQTPVAIAIGVRYGKPKPETPASIAYTRIIGTKEAKLGRLKNIRTFSDFDWEGCADGWGEPMLPIRDGSFFNWPLLTDVFPWRSSGVQTKRPWVVSPSPDVLRQRWSDLISQADKRDAFHETRDRKIDKAYKALPGYEKMGIISALTAGSPIPPLLRYAYRSFDRQWIIADNRVIDFSRPGLWRAHSESQVYLTSLFEATLGKGPALVATGEIPDLHHFRGSFGGADVLPLWRDSECTVPNVTSGLIAAVSAQLGIEITARELFAYTYALLGSLDYTERFSDSLSTSAPRLPLTENPELFRKVAEIGSRLLEAHTYGTRFAKDDSLARSGAARCTKAIGATYPEEFSYSEEKKILSVGDGEFGPVAESAWSYEVSGLSVIDSWLGYRMRKGAGKTSSSLDGVRPKEWTSTMSSELLSLIWLLEETLEINDELSSLLPALYAGNFLESSQLPEPSAAERSATDEEEETLSLLSE